MLHRLISKIRRYGLRNGRRVWWHSLTRRERGQLVVRLVLESSLLVLWATLLLTWSNSLWGQEGFVFTTSFGWILLLWLPAFYVVRTRWFKRALKRVLSLLGKMLAWVLGLKFRPSIQWKAWRPFWFVSLAGCLYLLIWHRPWGLFPALFIVALTVLVFLQLHVGRNFGTGIPASQIEVAQPHHPLAFFVFAFEAMPGWWKVVPSAPLIWVFMCPFLWYFGVGTWKEILQSGYYWMCGLVALVYWLVWAVAKWRKYGNIVTKRGDVIGVVPQPGIKPGVRIASASISKIATVSGEALLGAYPTWDPGFQFAGGDKYRARWVRASFVEAVESRRRG